MKVYFCKAHGYKNHYFYSYEENDYKNPAVPRIENFLKERFSSIVFVENKQHMFKHFKFKNKAEETEFFVLHLDSVFEL